MDPDSAATMAANPAASLLYSMRYSTDAPAAIATDYDIQEDDDPHAELAAAQAELAELFAAADAISDSNSGDLNEGLADVSSTSTKKTTDDDNESTTSATTSGTKAAAQFNKRYMPPTIAARTFALSNQKENLWRLRNLLKLPKARRWIICEFFYSDLDRFFFQTPFDNDFPLCVRDSFPNLLTRRLKRAEWRQIRHLLGKPRRMSEAYLQEERLMLEKKRSKIRQIYGGEILHVDEMGDDVDLPDQIPDQISVGAKVVCRIRMGNQIRDAVLMGTVIGVVDHFRYKVQFDKDGIPAQTVVDEQIASCNSLSFINLSTLFERNRLNKNATDAFQNGNYAVAKYYLQQAAGGNTQFKFDPILNLGIADPEAYVRDTDHIGTYPARFLVLVVKLNKLLRMKRGLVEQLTLMNSEAEKLSLIVNDAIYPRDFQHRYAQIVLDLESVNKRIDNYVCNVSDQSDAILSHVSSDANVASKPDAIKALTRIHAGELVQRANESGKKHVKNRRALELTTKLLSLLLQARTLCGQKVSAFEMTAVSDSINEISKSLSDESKQVFQDNVEVHFVHLLKHNSLTSCIGPTTQPSNF